MKKILLTTAAVAALSTSAFADMMENQFYLRGDVDAAYFTKFKVNGSKVKQKFAMGIDLGVGYSVMDNVRAEIIYTQPFSLKMKGTVANTNPAQKLTVKPTVRALLARVHGDVVDLGMGKIFLTGGLGWSQVKASYAIDNNPTAKSKNKNTVAWTVGAGVAFDVAEGVHLDLAYSYRDYGKTKKASLNGQSVDGTSNSFRSHNGTVGVRFDI